MKATTIIIAAVVVGAAAFVAHRLLKAGQTVVTSSAPVIDLPIVPPNGGAPSPPLPPVVDLLTNAAWATASTALVYQRPLEKLGAPTLPRRTNAALVR